MINTLNNPTPAAKPSPGLTARACQGCQKKLHITAYACPQCGAIQRSRLYKNKLIAIFLAFFLGGLGVHRIYLGQWWGVFYLLFFWTLIPAIAALIEIIFFIRAKQPKWDAKYNQDIPAGPADKGGLAVTFLIVSVIFTLAISGIFAAIAIPQYINYSQRAQVKLAIEEMLPLKKMVNKFYQFNQYLPDSNTLAGLDEPHIIKGGHEVRMFKKGIRLYMNSLSSEVDTQTIIFAPFLRGETMEWDCTGGTLPQNYRPPNCRKKAEP